MPDGSYFDPNEIVVIGRGGGGGKGGGTPTTPRIAYEAPNSVQSKATGRIVDGICEGPIVGLYKGAASIYLDETPLVEEDGTENFTGLTWSLRTGTPDQDHISGFPQVENEQTVQVRVKASSPVIRTINNSDLDAIRITIRIPTLARQDKTNGDVYETSAQYAIDVKENGGEYSEAVNHTVTGKNTSPFEIQHRVELPDGGNPWTFRVRRISEDNDDDSSIQNETHIQSYTEIIDAKLTYPNTAHVGLVVDSEQFGGSVPRRGYVIKGLIVKVPTNYDPITRQYNGFWDGTFKNAWTDNPAWCLYDVLTDTMHGLGEYISETQVDKWALYRISQYCDELVPDGAGGYEPRFTFNLALQTRRETYQVLSSIVSCFRGMIYWSTGEMTTITEQETDAAKVVTPANVIGGTFHRTGSAASARYNAAVVTWNDPENLWKPNFEVYINKEAVRTFGYNQKDAVAFGCTRRSQARRYATWLVETGLLETEMLTYRAFFDHADIRPGEIVKIYDPSQGTAEIGGRIASASGTSLVLDRNVTINPGNEYYISYETKEKQVVTKLISNSSGETNTITPAETIPDEQIPNVNAMWTLLSTDLEPEPFRVLSNREAGEGVFEITALQVHVGKIDAIEQGLTIETVPNYNNLTTGRILPPYSPLVQENLFTINNSVKNRITISWQNDDERVIGYQVEYRRHLGTWVPAGTSGVPMIEIVDLEPDYYDFSIQAISPAGLSRKIYVYNQQIVGKNAPPGDVENITAIHLDVDHVVIEWDPVTDLDLTGYVVRLADVPGDSWEDAIYQDEVRANTFRLDFSDTIQRAIYVRAVDENGNLSENTASIIVQAKTPDDVTEFAVTPDGSNIQARWTPLSSPVKYEVRSGTTWGSGDFIGQFTGDHASFLWPGDVNTTFWIKAVSDLGKYSINAVFARANTWVMENRNLILTYDNKGDSWVGVTRNMTVDVDGDLMLNDTGGVFSTDGTHYFTVDLGYETRTRVWIESDMKVVSSSPLTWANASFAWEDSDASAPWQTQNDTGTNLRKKIMVYEGLDSDVVDGSTFNQIISTENSAPIILGSSPVYADALYLKGLQMSSSYYIGWYITYPSEFTHSFRLRMDGPPGADVVYFTLAGSGIWVIIGWDDATSSFYCEDSSSNRIDFPVSIHDPEDFVFIALSQGSSSRTLYVWTRFDDAKYYETAAFSPLGTFDTIFAFDAREIL